MFGGGGGDTVGANVVLTANNTGYDSSMQQSAGITDRLGQSYDSLKAKIDRGFTHASHASLGLAAADVASLTAATVAAGRYQDKLRQLQAQSNVLNQSFGQGQQRMREYERAVNSVRTSFGETTGAAATLVQTISGFERGGSTGGLAKMAADFEKMSQTTQENASALAQSVLTLDQAMGSGLKQAKAYSDQLVSMAEISNTNATSLANFAAQIAPLGRQLNMTQSEITGFAAAFSKAGQDGYRASNVFSQMTSDIAQSLQTNSPRLAAYASLLGVTTRALKQMSGAAVTAGLYDAIGRRGSSSLQTLNELGYDGLNVTRVISAVTQRSGGVGNMVRLANGAYADNSSTAGGQTASQQFAKLGQDLQRDGEIIGAKFLPALQGVMTFVDKIAAGVTSFMDGPGGDLVALFAAVAAPIGVLAGGLLALHGAILPLMTLFALSRSSVGQGFREGLAGTNVIGSDPRMAERPHVQAWYGRGRAIGEAAAGRIPDRGNYVLTGRGGRGPFGLLPPKASAAEQVAAREASQREMEASAPGLFVRGARGGAAMVNTYLAKPQFEPSIYPNPLDRTPGFSMRGKNAGAARENAAATETAGALDRLKAGISSASASIREFAASLTKGASTVTEADTAQAAAASDAADTISAASIKLSGSLNEAAAEAAAAASSQAAMTATVKATMAEMATMGVGGSIGALKGAGGMALGGAAMAGRGALAGLAGMSPMGWGMLAMMGAPMLSGPLHGLLDVNQGGQGPGPSDVSGTGLSFGVSRVIAPVASGGGAGFNPLAPTQAQAYSAGQRKDFVNPGVRNIKSAAQAAAIYGPVWGTMGGPNQASLGQDLLSKLGYAGYMQFVSLIQSGNYSSFGKSSAAAAAGAPGGLSMAFSSLQQSQEGQTNPAGANFRDLISTFLSAPRTSSKKAPADLVGMVPVVGSWLTTFGATAGSSLSAGMGTKTKTKSDWGGVLPWGSSTNYGLTGTGMDFASSLFGGTPSGGQQSRLGQALFNMPKNLSSKDQLAYILAHVSKSDLAAALQQQGIAPTGNQKTDIAAALSALSQKSADQPSALRGLGLTDAQQRELQPLDAANPGYYGQTLYDKGIGQRRLSQLSLEAGSLIPGTIAATQAYGAQQLSLLSPYMAPQQQLFGSMTGAAGISGMNAGMISTPLGGFNGQFSLLGQAQGALSTARGLQDQGNLSGNADALNALNSSATSLEQAYTSQLQTMKQYEMTLEQLNFSSRQFKQSMAWQAEQEKLTVSREKADQARNVGREEYSFHLQRKRAEEDFQRSRKYAEEDYDLSRSRAMHDFAHQTEQMIKQASMSMMDVYRQNPAQGFTSAQFLLYNNAQQTQLMKRQEGQLGTLRGMGLSKDAIQQLGLTSSSNNQELNGLFNQIQANPALIDQLNSAVKQRLAAAGSLATDASSMSYQEQVFQFNQSLDRSAEDFAKQMKRSQDAFDLEMGRSAHDFAHQMHLQNADFHRQLARQAQDYNTAVSHSWTTFTQGVENTMHQMNVAAKPLTDTASTLAGVAKTFGDSNIGKTAAALEKATPLIMQVLTGMSNLLDPKTPTSGAKEPLFLKLLDILNSKGKFFMGAGAGGTAPVNASVGSGMPKAIAERMAADHPHSGWCLADVADVLGAPHRDPTAWAAWQNDKGHRHLMNGLIPAPIGAPIFFGPEYGGGDGHVAINAGFGMMWSEDANDRWEKKKIWPGVLGWSDHLNGATVAPSYGLPGFAKGAWDLPRDMIAQIHKGEMVIPAKVALAVRSAITKSQVASLHTPSHSVIQHVDARTFQTKNETNFNGDVKLDGIQDPAQFAAQMKEMARLRALVKR